MFRMLNKKSSFKEFMKGNGFYILTGVALIAVVVTAMIVPRKGEGNVAQESDKYANNRPVAAEDISGLRVPTIDPRMEEDDFIIMEEAENQAEPETTQVTQEANTQEDIVTGDSTTEQQAPQIAQEEVVAETFSSTTSTSTEIFHADNDVFAWPLENKIIYPYSDNDIGKSFMNPTLERTMRSFGLFIQAKEDSKVQVAAQGKVLAITDYPDSDLVSDWDYPQVGTAVIVDHGNDWKTVYGLHGGQPLVEVGDMIQTGDIIGSVGEASKDFSLTGTNLYFQILKNDVPMNPEDKLGDYAGM